MRDFVNLHVHTNLGSLLDSLQDVDDLFDLVNLKGQKALAITDHGTLAAFFDAYKASKRTGIKFIPGLEAYFVHSYDVIEPEDGKGRKKTERRKHIVLLAQNEIGYRNLLKINYDGFKNNVISMGRVFPRISWEVLEKYNEGIIATSACGNGILANPIFQDNYDEAVEYAIVLSNIFKNRFYLEIQPHTLEDGEFNQIKLNNQLIKMSKELKIPLVVATDAHYLTKSDEKVHDILMAINSKKALDDPDRHRYGIDEFYVKDGDEVYDFLVKHHGNEVAEEAVSNTILIAEKCDPPTYMEVKGNHLPVFDPRNEPDYESFMEWKKNSNIPADLSLDKSYMRFHIIKGFVEKFGNSSDEMRKERWSRVKSELKVLEDNNFSSYMLITADMIKWAKNNNILAGIGRGSVGGSLIAYLLGIHGVDPFDYGLLFERFQNAYKKDLPDIDTDFTSEGRDKVQEYVRNKYGRDNCAQVSNINTYTPKNVIPDLVKSMRNVMPGLIPEGTYYVSVADAIKAAIPDTDADGNHVKTLERAMELSPNLREFANRCPELMKYADRIIGMPKDYSTHAAGMVVSDVPIYEFAPLRVDKNGEVAVQYEKSRCEAEGLVKMDFLAIATLDIIDETFKNICKLGVEDAPKHMEDIPLDDKETYEMIQKGNTKCVFQLGKSGIMASLCKRIKPKNILDIATINSLGRPAGKDIRELYLNRRTGKEKVIYPHFSLKEPLNETYGLAITEEQLMGVAKSVAGWDLNKADGLRKFTKLKGKKPELALQLEVDFIEGMIKTHGVEYELAKNIWDQYVANFVGYGFNLAHAVFYSINGYITAYLKCHYPAAFLAAYLKIKTSKGGLNKDDEINGAKQECRRLGIKIVPPDINESKSGYEVLNNTTILMGLGSVKGMGDKALEEIMKKQRFSSFMEFLYRVDGRVINKSKIEALAKAGCFDSFNVSRKDIHDDGKKIRDKMNTFIRKKEKDGYDVDMAIEDFSFKMAGNEWSKQEKLQYEQEVLGELVSGSINDLFPGFFTNSGITLISKLKTLPNRYNILVEVIIKSFLREFKIKNGKYAGRTMAKYLVQDVMGADVELTIWPSQYAEIKEKLVIGRPIRAVCEVSDFNGAKTLMLKELQKAYGE
jgi:DNA polymerase-3 subunit alpha